MKEKSKEEIRGIISEVTDQYVMRFAQSGISVIISIKQVAPLFHYSPYNHSQPSFITLIEDVARHIFCKKAKKHGSDSRFWSVVISFCPQGLAKKQCKEYAFLIKLRDDLNDRTRKKITRRVENLFQKKEQQFLKGNLKTACQNCWVDLLRYSFLQKYSYKKEAGGIDLNTVKLIVMVAVGMLLLSLYFFEWVKNGFLLT